MNHGFTLMVYAKVAHAVRAAASPEYLVTWARSLFII